MPSSEELAPQEGTALEQLERLEAQAGPQDYESEAFNPPRLAIVQGQSRDVPDDANQGEFYNKVSKTVYGSRIGFVLAKNNKGRFLDFEGRTYVTAEPVAPSFWPEKYAGREFAKIEDAEERFKIAVDADEREWGSGPPIQTTYNYVGYVVDANEAKPIESPTELVPVRLTLKSTDTKTARNWTTLLKPLRRSPWKQVFQLETVKRSGGGYEWYGIKVQYGRDPSDEEQLAAATLESQIGDTRIAGGDDEPAATPAKPDDTPDGGMDV